MTTPEHIALTPEQIGADALARDYAAGLTASGFTLQSLRQEDARRAVEDFLKLMQEQSQ